MREAFYTLSDVWLQINLLTKKNNYVTATTASFKKTRSLYVNLLTFILL